MKSVTSHKYDLEPMEPESPAPCLESPCYAPDDSLLPVLTDETIHIWWLSDSEKQYHLACETLDGGEYTCPEVHFSSCTPSRLVLALPFEKSHLLWSL